VNNPAGEGSGQNLFPNVREERVAAAQSGRGCGEDCGGFYMGESGKLNVVSGKRTEREETPGGLQNQPPTQATQGRVTERKITYSARE